MYVLTKNKGILPQHGKHCNWLVLLPLFNVQYFAKIAVFKIQYSVPLWDSLVSTLFPFKVEYNSGDIYSALFCRWQKALHFRSVEQTSGQATVANIRPYLPTDCHTESGIHQAEFGIH